MEATYRWITYTTNAPALFAHRFLSPAQTDDQKQKTENRENNSVFYLFRVFIASPHTISSPRTRTSETLNKCETSSWNQAVLDPKHCSATQNCSLHKIVFCFRVPHAREAKPTAKTFLCSVSCSLLSVCVRLYENEISLKRFGPVEFIPQARLNFTKPRQHHKLDLSDISVVDFIMPSFAPHFSPEWLVKRASKFPR